MSTDSPVLNCLDFISAEGNVLTTDSFKVAQVHQKRHNDLLRLIRQRIAEAGGWGVRNFTETLHINEQNGESYSFFKMTQPGYQFLVGKITGKKAIKHQIAYIDAFGAMAAFIQKQSEGLRFRYDKKRAGSQNQQRPWEPSRARSQPTPP